MIPSEQLVAALERLDPRDLEVLDLSMRRGVPDEALANVMNWDTSEVARRRAAAIEHLANDLGVERGEDLGQVLKALLAPETWTAVDAKRWPAAATKAPEEPAPEPVAEAPPRRRTWRVLAIAFAGLAALAAAGAVGAVLLVDKSGGSDKSSKEVGTRRFTPAAGGPLAAPFPTSTDISYQYLTVQLTRPTPLYTEPGGQPSTRLSVKTEWGSPRILSVVRQQGDWLAVLAPELSNGAVGWIRTGQGQLRSVAWSLDADLSRRVLVVKKDGHQVKRLPISIGRKSNPTPEGRFAVTDKLRTSDGGPPYGCCVLALTGHQTRLPRDWPGGDRLAVHATSDTSGIGKAVSLGCMRVDSASARWLIDTIPLGAPLTIRA